MTTPAHPCDFQHRFVQHPKLSPVQLLGLHSPHYSATANHMSLCNLTPTAQQATWLDVTPLVLLCKLPKIPLHNGRTRVSPRCRFWYECTLSVAWPMPSAKELHQAVNQWQLVIFVCIVHTFSDISYSSVPDGWWVGRADVYVRKIIF